MTEWDYGLRVLARIREDVAEGRERSNERWEPFTEQFIAEIARADTFVDCGAEYGFYISLAKKYGSRHLHILALEPDPVRYELLLCEHPDCYVRKLALSDKSEWVRTRKPGAGVSMSFEGLVHDSGEVGGVQATTLDNLLGDLSVDVLKMDIEGAEDLAFAGMQRVKPKTMFVEFHPPSQSETRLALRERLKAEYSLDDDILIYGGRAVLRRAECAASR